VFSDTIFISLEKIKFSFFVGRDFRPGLLMQAGALFWQKVFKIFPIKTKNEKLKTTTQNKKFISYYFMLV